MYFRILMCEKMLMKELQRAKIQLFFLLGLIWERFMKKFFTIFGV